MNEIQRMTRLAGVKYISPRELARLKVRKFLFQTYDECFQYVKFYWVYLLVRLGLRKQSALWQVVFSRKRRDYGF